MDRSHTLPQLQITQQFLKFLVKLEKLYLVLLFHIEFGIINELYLK